MRHYFVRYCYAAAVSLLVMADTSDAVTVTINRNVETNNNSTDTDGNRPFFVDNYSDGTITFTNPDGYTGTATPGVDNMSTVTGVGLGLGGDGTNALPMGAGLNFDIRFTVQTTGAAGGVLTDGGSAGLGVDSSASQTDSNTTQLTTGEQLLFDNLQLTNVSFDDPLGLLQSGATVGNPRWRVLRSPGHAAGDMATTSSDPDGTVNPTQFNTATSIENNYTAGLISPPTGLASPLYLTTTGGSWPLKGIGYQVEINYELATPPPSRRTFLFGEPVQPGTYEGTSSHQISDNDTTISITAVGNGALFDTNDIGVGVNSAEDDLDPLGSENGDAFQRRIDGNLPMPEAIHFSFDQDVSLESLTIGSLSLDGTESVVLSYDPNTGPNPFAGLTGYSGDYTLGSDSITFNRLTGGQTPFPITFGMNGQSEILITEGTVLSLTSSTSIFPADDGGILLDMITVRVPDAGLAGDYNGDGTVDAADYVLWRKDPAAHGGDPAGYNTWRANFGGTLTPGSGSSPGAVPETTSDTLLIFAAACFSIAWRKRAI
ncbi:MAG TPA: hypothetical protein VGK58_19655 [Lacipirellulaceae bacterium]